MKYFILLVVSIFFNQFLYSQYKKDGTPDMRYNSNKNRYSPYTYKESSTQRNYKSGGTYKIQKGYQKKDGSIVTPHIKTSPDDKEWNNLKPRRKRKSNNQFGISN